MDNSDKFCRINGDLLCNILLVEDKLNEISRKLKSDNKRSEEECNHLHACTTYSSLWRTKSTYL